MCDVVMLQFAFRILLALVVAVVVAVLVAGCINKITTATNRRIMPSLMDKSSL